MTVAFVSDPFLPQDMGVCWCVAGNGAGCVFIITSKGGSRSPSMRGKVGLGLGG